MVDFEWYRSFVAIYKHNSVSEAAKARIMTQPAMSQHLASLEAEVGEALFTRTSRKIVPTERGKQLYSQLAPLIECLEETTMSMRAASMPTPTVLKIGSAHEFYSERIVPLLAKINICTISHFGTADQLLEWLKEEKVDLIVTSKKYVAPGIEYTKLYDEQFVLIAPKRLEAPITDSLQEKERWLASQTWISYGLELPIIRRVWREHFKKRPLIKPVHVIPNLHMIAKAVETGAGLSAVPTYMLEKKGNVAIQTIYYELAVKNELFLAYSSKHRRRPEINQMIELLREQR